MINYIYVIISMILDCLISNYISYQATNLSIFTPIFTIVSLSIILKSYRKKREEYLKTLVILGTIYSLCFANNVILNIISFFLIGLINIFIDKQIISNTINTVIISILDIIFYYVINYIIIRILNINGYGIWYLINVLRNSIILNVIYAYLSYKIMNNINK